MSRQPLEDYSKDQLIEELINRTTFAGVVVFHRGDAKDGRLDPGEIVITKSPPLTSQNVQHLLNVGRSLVSNMFGEDATSNLVSNCAVDTSLRLDEGGVVRIGKSRVSLDLIVEQYENGMTPEEMVRAYDSLLLADVYATIAHYLRYREEVMAYLQRRQSEAERLRAKIESERPRVTREELVARTGNVESQHAPASQ